MVAGKIRPGTGSDESAEVRAWRAARRRFVDGRWEDEPESIGVACHQIAGGDVWLVALTGEHDLTTIPLLDLHTRHVWPRCRVAVIDLSGVTFIDSTMISWLLRVEAALEEGEGFTLSIVEGPADCVTARLFKCIRMSHVLACYPTRRAAFMQAAAGSSAVAWPPLAAATIRESAA